jgi:hypothetical protein
LAVKVIDDLGQLIDDLFGVAPTPASTAPTGQPAPLASVNQQRPVEALDTVPQASQNSSISRYYNSNWGTPNQTFIVNDPCSFICIGPGSHWGSCFVKDASDPRMRVVAVDAPLVGVFQPPIVLSPRGYGAASILTAPLELLLYPDVPQAWPQKRAPITRTSQATGASGTPVVWQAPDDMAANLHPHLLMCEGRRFVTVAIDNLNGGGTYLFAPFFYLIGPGGFTIQVNGTQDNYDNIRMDSVGVNGGGLQGQIVVTYPVPPGAQVFYVADPTTGPPWLPLVLDSAWQASLNLLTMYCED